MELSDGPGMEPYNGYCYVCGERCYEAEFGSDGLIGYRCKDGHPWLPYIDHKPQDIPLKRDKIEKIKVSFYKCVISGDFQFLPRYFSSGGYSEITWGRWVLSWSRYE